jgi:hypothetical protein
MHASLANINGHTMFSILLSINKLDLLKDYTENSVNLTFVASERKIEFHKNEISEKEDEEKNKIP